MSLEQTTELYASVLRQLLPEGVYDTAEMTHVADDIYAHAKALAQADIDAHRLLQVLETIPVDLLADYEREYGLPMQCMMPGSQTIEERISVLRWIRQHRNVMNRKYLEQILAIFGITLVDVVKHRPMLCTASCTSPVNTERLRYKVLLRLQYPMTADMSCIIENYLPGYLRVEWVVDMPWGEWILNAGFELSGENIRYTAYKTNQRDFYDSYADFDLVTALVRSFHDANMQQWQGFIDALEAFKQPNQTQGYKSEWFNTGCHLSLADTCAAFSDIQGKYFYAGSYNQSPSCNAPPMYHVVVKCDVYPVYTYTHNYELDHVTFISDTLIYNVNYINLANKIISNTSSSNQAISLLAEAYLEAVANSIFNTDESKQFVRLSDLLSQFELNKTLRT